MGREPAWSDSLWYHWRFLVVSTLIITQCFIFPFNNVMWLWFSTHNHIKSASELSAGCDYSLFKAGIKPMWEDPRNNNGGRWLISLEKKQRSSELDNYWLEVVSFISARFHTFIWTTSDCVSRYCVWLVRHLKNPVKTSVELWSTSDPKETN